jgi:hypothetical protein
LPGPGAVCHEIQRILKPGGIHFGSENNQSRLRSIFDLLIRLAPIWHEEAGEQPLLSERLLREWTENLPVRIESHSSVFIPPHICNWIGTRGASRLVQAADRFAQAVPFLRTEGGLLLFEIVKLA